jgi:hypothetical protein
VHLCIPDTGGYKPRSIAVSCQSGGCGISHLTIFHPMTRGMISHRMIVLLMIALLMIRRMIVLLTIVLLMIHQMIVLPIRGGSVLYLYLDVCCSLLPTRFLL